MCAWIFFFPSITPNLGPNHFSDLSFSLECPAKTCALASKVATVKPKCMGPHRKKLPNRSVGLVKAWKEQKLDIIFALHNWQSLSQLCWS